MHTPILLIIFNRPEETKKVFEVIKQIKPETLFIAADGPRENVFTDSNLCAEARDIISKVDWPCKLETRFQEKNLGCKIHVSSSIDWFFKHVEEGIILEDDCLPDPSFFDFASSLLSRYKNNEEIMHINGTNFQFGHLRGEPNASYYFSRCPHIWGWATWKRAWNKYDVDMKDLNEYISSKRIYSLFKDKRSADFWISLWKHIKSKNIDTWDAQWAYTVMKYSGIAITPNYNLVENIGFGNSSTHTANKNDGRKQSKESINSIIHPQTIKVDMEADDFLVKTQYIESIFQKLLRKLKLR